MKKRKGKIEITQTLKEEISRLAEEYGLVLVMLFGSQSRGDAHEGSDIDVAFRPGKPLSEKQEAALNYELVKIFRNDRVDTVDLSRVSPLLRRRILEDVSLLYDRSGLAFPTFELYALRSYIEAMPLFNIRREKLRAALASII